MHFVSWIPKKVVLQQNQKKLGKTFDVETFNLNEEMGGQKGRTLKRCEILSIFSLLNCFCLTCTAR